MARPDQGRSAVAYDEEFRKWQRQIDGLMHDRGMSRDQREAAIAALRLRQVFEAKNARRRVKHEEKLEHKAHRTALIQANLPVKPRL